ncbi:hypothetical protein C8A00DRAFT_13621 [Chaetomidium leptoderma]|uniref:Uncharacterized protein n=1 Tax=Chaetomidium leptoderma TaxID=669021 RepID=A0AAN6VQA1_9PEZI|nr:hypothetical protein C8A00DRAFT_13621 [Chaetomidium leptoderma]
MGSKRNFNAATADDNEEPSSSSSKRRREQQSSKPKQAEGKPDPTYGQRAAFPGLDGDDAAQLTDDDLELEEDIGALAYLRAVRQEASGVPNVLVAPKVGPQLPAHLQTADDIDRSIYDDGVGDSRGYYHDGAYTAAPDPDPSTSPSEDSHHDNDNDPDRIAAQNAALRNAYFASLTTQFLALRTLLHRTPPLELVTALPRDHGTEVGSFGAKSWTFRVWTRRIRHTDPLPVQVAALDRQSVLKLLRVILGGKFIRRGYELRERTSSWLWALLARLPDRGEMDYAEVGWVRELGKRAVLMMVSIAQMDALREEVEGDFEGEGEEEVDEEESEFVGGEMVADGEEEEETTGGGGETRADGGETESKPPVTATAAAADNNNEDEAGEMDMDIDEGEVTDDEPPATTGASDIEADIAAAKARLLARLEEKPDTQEEEEEAAPAEADAEDDHLQDGNGEGEAAMFDQARARVNMRATLNMILTVAGEFYGQRDLLEFRDPFPAL